LIDVLHLLWPAFKLLSLHRIVLDSNSPKCCSGCSHCESRSLQVAWRYSSEQIHVGNSLVSRPPSGCSQYHCQDEKLQTAADCVQIYPKSLKTFLTIGQVFEARFFATQVRYLRSREPMAAIVSFAFLPLPIGVLKISCKQTSLHFWRWHQGHGRGGLDRR